MVIAALKANVVLTVVVEQRDAARKEIAARMIVVLKGSAARMLVAPKVIAAIRPGLNDLAVRAMSVARNGIVKNHVIAPSHLATEAGSSSAALCQ